MFRIHYLLCALLMFEAVAAAESLALVDESEIRSDSEEKRQVLLTLPEALSLTYEHSPRLRYAALGVDAAEAGGVQAGLPPNPEISYESENFDGSGPYGGGALREDTVTLSQRIEIGGKRSGRKRLAETGAAAARIDGELIRQSVVTETVVRFVIALADQLRLQNAKDIFALTQNLSDAAKARVKSGKEPPYFVMNANASLFTAKADYERAKNEFILSRRRLAALWMDSEPSFNRLTGNLENISRPPIQEVLMMGIESYPLAHRNAMILARARADANLQAARQWPDMNLSVGERRLREFGERSYVAGISVAIPLFDRNQGALRAAEVRVRQAEEEVRRAGIDFSLEIENTLSDLWTAYHEVEYFRKAGLAAGSAASKAAAEGYREGKLNYVEALDSRRALAEVQSRYIDSLEQYHKLRARLNELTGRAAEVAGGWLIRGNDK